MKQKFKKQFPVSSLMLMLALVLSSFTSISLQAQDRVTGTVTGKDGIPLPGVNVLQKGTSKGAVTDFDGKFTLLLASGNKTLVFSYIGFKTKEVTVGANNIADVILEEDVESLEEVVVIGYAAVEREKILGSVGSVKAESIVQAAPVDALQGVQGKLSGVQVLSNNGPGEGFDIRIRGINTFNAGATGPLYVVDGQQTFDIDNLDPSDIASLEVIKDGATAAIYGARAANGVVIIKTKSGKSGKVTVSINTTTGVNTLVGQVPTATGAQGLLVEQLATANRATSDRQRDTLSLLFRNSPDLQDLLTRPGIRQQTNVAISGGGEKARFYWNTGIIDEETIINNSDFRRINTRLKVDADVTDKFKAGTLINMSFEDINGANIRQVLQQTTRRVTFLPIFEPDGTFASATPAFRTVNPLAVLQLATNNQQRLRGNTFNYVELNLSPSLKVRSTLGLDFGYRRFRVFVPKELDPQFDALAADNFTVDGSERHEFNYSVQQENVLSYNNTWGKHNFGAFAGMQITEESVERLNLEANFENSLIRTLGNVVPGTITPSGNRSNDTRDIRTSIFSLFSGFSYDFDSKYLVSATIRRDGSSRFGDGNRFGYFPSASLGWKVSKENFLKNNTTVNNLLLRASWGITGNDRIQDFRGLALLEPNTIFNGATGFDATQIANADLKWEETTSINLGFDLGMFKNRLKVAFDLYRTDTRDLLQSLPLAEESSFQNIQANVGAIRNEGIDIAINGTLVQTKDFTWDAGFNIGLTQNEVLELSLFDTADGSPQSFQVPGPGGLEPYLLEVGQPIGNIIGFRQDGIFQYDESNAYIVEGEGDNLRSERLFPNFDENGFFLGTYNRADGTAFPQERVGEIQKLTAAGRELEAGDFIWDDVNGDLVIDADNDGSQVLGNGIATVFGGLTQDFKYKTFTLGLLFDYSFGNDTYREYDHERNAQRARIFTPSPERIENAWSNPGDIAVFPILQRRPQNRIDFSSANSPTANNLYVDDGSFIKWRYVRFGYDLPKKALQSLKLGLTKVNFNFAVNNVLTWTNYQGFNPEFGTRGNPLTPGNDELRFPNDREFLLGLQVKF